MRQVDALLGAVVRAAVRFALVRARVAEELPGAAENSVQKMSKRDFQVGHSLVGELPPCLASTHEGSAHSEECRSEQAGGCCTVVGGVRLDELDALALADEGPHAAAAEWPGAARAADRGWDAVPEQSKRDWLPGRS